MFRLSNALYAILLDSVLLYLGAGGSYLTVPVKMLTTWEMTKLDNMTDSFTRHLTFTAIKPILDIGLGRTTKWASLSYLNSKRSHSGILEKWLCWNWAAGGPDKLCEGFWISGEWGSNWRIQLRNCSNTITDEIFSAENLRFFFPNSLVTWQCIPFIPDYLLSHWAVCGR